MQPRVARGGQPFDAAGEGGNLDADVLGSRNGALRVHVRPSRNAANMSTAIRQGSAAFHAGDAWRSMHAPPRVDLEPLTPTELHVFLRGGEPEADDCERLLASCARARAAIDLAIADGLHALQQGDRLARLGCHLGDYAREVLDLGTRAAQSLARLGRELRTRPLLRAALREGRVRLRAAETILAVVSGDAEAEWVERAARCTVRELEAAVRRASHGGDDADDDWFALRTQLPPEDRAVVDAALELAGEIMPGSSRMERLEAIAQETLGEAPGDPDADDGAPLDPAFRRLGPREASRRAALEAETERWSVLPGVVEIAALEVDFPATASAAEIDARLRDLAALRAGWDRLLGFCAHAVRRSGLHRVLGFASFRHYCEERLGLSARAVEQRAALEERLWASPALREGRDQGLPFEKLRLLASLPEAEIACWTARAHALTCIALSRALDDDRERQLRARGKLVASLPRRIAVLLAAAMKVVRDRTGALIPAAKCLAVMAAHFIATWSRSVPRSRNRSRRVRDRDGGHCQVPGCSHGGTHAHHIAFRSHGGGDEPANQVALCGFHHLRCIHGGLLRVFGRAPDSLT
jgi:hypothetical protein